MPTGSKKPTALDLSAILEGLLEADIKLIYGCSRSSINRSTAVVWRHSDSDDEIHTQATSLAGDDVDSVVCSRYGNCCWSAGWLTGGRRLHENRCNLAGIVHPAGPGAAAMGQTGQSAWIGGQCQWTDTGDTTLRRDKRDVRQKINNFYSLTADLVD